MNKPKISIIVPCYKVEKYLPRCLDSLMNQTLNDIEVICINDGSPDHCLDILNEYKSKYGDRIVIIDKKNEGVWRGRKDGIKVARGEYTCFVDSDDYVAPDYAEKLYNAVSTQNADIAVCGFYRVDVSSGEILSEEMNNKAKNVINMKKNPEGILYINGAPWNKIFKTELLHKMDELVHIPVILDDLMFLLLIYLRTEKIVFINDSLVYYMIRPGSIVSNIRQEQVESTYEAFKEIRGIYKKEKPELLDVLDLMAFLHLGISLIFRLSYDPNCDLKTVIRSNTEFLNREFPLWKNSKYLKTSFVLSHHSENGKLWVVRQFYRLHAFKLFMHLYRFCIDKLHIDIKW